jgi:hypothetical protein
MLDFVRLLDERPSPFDPPSALRDGGDKPAARPPDPLLRALRDCRDRKSMSPLYDYREKEMRARREGDSLSELRRIERLWELLKLPAQPPAK